MASICILMINIWLKKSYNFIDLVSVAFVLGISKIRVAVKFAQAYKIARRYFCTKIKLHGDAFARADNLS